MERPLYLFRGVIVGSVRQEGDLSVGVVLLTKEEHRSKTYNFKKYAKELDLGDEDRSLKITEKAELYEFINELKGKYR